MNMDYADACKIVVIRHKLYGLRDAVSPSQYPPIDAQLERLDPYVRAADNLVMHESDQQFAGAAKALRAEVKPITDAIANISQINTALKTAATMINDIIAVVGAVTKL